MHGVIIRSFEGFLRQTYGEALWGALMTELDAGIERFEPMFHYADGLAERLVAIASRRLGKSSEALFEDYGTFLVAHPASERVRRLLRFGGADYEDFLGSLEELAGRARLAVPDLDLPALELAEIGVGDYRLRVASPIPGAAAVYRGLLRALADDYGALVMVDAADGDGDAEVVTIRMLAADFAEGRGFALADPPRARGGEAPG